MPNLTLSFSQLASVVSRWTGRPLVFFVCCATVLVWAATGPLFGYSDTWQLVINTGTTIVTFLMVFLIQNTQNRDNAALQAKLDELIRVSRAKNDFIGIEHLSDQELEDILAECERHRPEVLHRVEARAGRDRGGTLLTTAKRTIGKTKATATRRGATRRRAPAASG